MTLRTAILGFLLAFGACWLSPVQPSHAAPAQCDNKCRLRQYFYFPQNTDTKYRKYMNATCLNCSGGNQLCMVKTTDVNTNATCTIPAGEENLNKYWIITTVSACPHTGTELSVEATPQDPVTTDNPSPAANSECPGN